MMKNTLVALSLLISTSALADEAKSVDMTQPIVVNGVTIKDVDTHDAGDWKLITEGPKTGERIDLDPTCDHCKPLTLGVMLGRTLKSIKRDEDSKVTGPMRESWAAFAEKIKTDKEAKLSHGQIVLLNERIEAIVPSGELITLLKKMVDPTYSPKLPE
jgi:hypothetical protein